MQERFDKEAKEWDKLPRRVQNAMNIAEVIKENVELKKDMHILDFGVGTGLLSEFLADSVGRITGVDNSKGMLEEFIQKKLPCEVEAIEADLTKEDIEGEYDGIISSMTLHHIEDIDSLLKKFYAMLKSTGFIALADLTKEDGSFHSCNDGVFHFGFDFYELERRAKEIGFYGFRIEDCGVIKKPHGEFEVKCIIGVK